MNWIHYILQDDKICDFCTCDFPRGIWCWINDNNDVMCETCYDKTNPL